MDLANAVAFSGLRYLEKITDPDSLTGIGIESAVNLRAERELVVVALRGFNAQLSPIPHDKP